ncbi:MAG: hypothetical protein JXR46_02290 [Calditrichaceae bacterium]|nr:hypothetical protein [Calditrichaceae bacterium]MBN2707851.1 hypothetical protein [Calditrichaceae bacterium]RQV94917.1 MAG: hypothetical protein EH224_09145 [Calditrichota bacterium]
MKKSLAIFCIFIVFIMFGCTLNTEKLNRADLINLMDQYLEALVKHDPAGVPLAANVKLVENTEVTPVGKGLWETATAGPQNFRIYVPDTVAGQVAFLGVIEENNNPTILAARLKLVDDKITEIDHLVIHGDTPLNPNMSQVRPAILEPLKPCDYVKREEMLKIANSYYEAIIQDNGEVAPFADDCQRRENGGTTANYDENSGEEVADDYFLVFRKMKCTEQLSTGCMSYITDINRRRFIAVDEKLGLVFAFSMFVHDGEPKVMKITGVPGVTELENNWGPFDLPAAHVFKIRNGQIHEIEAIGYIAKHGIKNGWE